MFKNIDIRNKGWLLSLLLILPLFFIGWGISIWVDSSIPLWLLLGFSIIYSVEKWLNYYTQRYKIIGIVYRLLLNLSVLSLFGLLIWSGVSLFSRAFMPTPLIGSLVFLGEIAVFIWSCRIALKNAWRQPSLLLTAFALFWLFIIFAFAGVQPVSEYKNRLFNNISNIFTGDENAETESENTEKKIVKYKDNWEIVLEKCDISGTQVTMELSVTSFWDLPRYFGGDELSPYTFICVDQFGIIYEDAMEKGEIPEGLQELLEGYSSTTEEPEAGIFYQGRYYPQETRTGELEFIVNPGAGDVALYIGRNTGFRNRSKIFDLGSVEAD